MENLNAEQIKKALECCHSGGTLDACYECPYLHEPILCDNIRINAATLIKELTEENERLSKKAETTSRLCQECHNEYENKIKDAKADTVRKMQEKLKRYYDRNDSYLGYSIAFNIDRVAKEMLEETNEKS